MRTSFDDFAALYTMGRTMDRRAEPGCPGDAIQHLTVSLMGPGLWKAKKLSKPATLQRHRA
jgi:hypothetical protein